MTNKRTKEKAPTTVATKQYVHIDTFLETAKVIYSMNSIQVSGFKAFMQGNHYQLGDNAFVPHLKKYLGIGDK